MPFQSEKQRRYLWANEPEIARDWTDTYGSRIRKDNGGIMQGGVQNFLGEQPMVNAPKYWQSAPDHEMTELAYITPKERDLLVDVDMYGTMRGGPNRGPSGIMSLNGWGSADEKQNVAGADISSGMDKDPGHKGWSTGVGANQTTQGTHGGWDTKQEHQKAQTQAFKDMGYKGAKLNRLVGGGPNIGNWASGFAGSKIGGGLGSMLFGPWGMLLGSLFGRGVGQRAYTASQTDEQETLKDILFGDNNILSSMFNKKNTPNIPKGGGIERVDVGDDFAKAKRLMTQPSDVANPFARTPVPLGKGDPYQQNYAFPDQMISTGIYEPGDYDNLSGIEGQEAKVIGPALIQMRILENKKGMEQHGGPKLTPDEERKLNQLKQMDKEEKIYSSIIT